MALLVTCIDLVIIRLIITKSMVTCKCVCCCLGLSSVVFEVASNHWMVSNAPTCC